MKIPSWKCLWISSFVLLQLVFHGAFAGTEESLQHNQEVGARKLDHSGISSTYDLMTAVKSKNKSNSIFTRSKVRKTRVRKTNKATDVLVLNETPNKTQVFEIPVPKIALSTSANVGSGAISKREISKHAEQQVKEVEVMRRDKLIKRNGLVASPSKNLEKYRLSPSVSEARTLLLAPLLIAGPMMLAEAMTVGGMGLAVPGFILLPVLLFPLIIVLFIIFI